MTEEAKKQGGVVVDTDVKLAFLSASALVSKAPCWVYFIQVCSSSGPANRWRVFDGFDTAGELKMVLALGSYDSVSVPLKYPVRFNHGLYIEFQTAGFSINVQYKEDY